MSTVKSRLILQPYRHSQKIQKTTMRRFVYYFVSSFLLCLGSGCQVHRDYSSYNWLLSMTVHTVAGVGVFMVSSYSILSRNTRRSSFSLSSTNNKNTIIDSYINNDSPLSSSSSFLVDTINTTSVVTADESVVIPTEKKKNTARNTTMMAMGSTDDDEAKLYCRVMGYYPFPKKNNSNNKFPTIIRDRTLLEMVT